MRKETGFTYIGLLILIAILGIIAAASVQVGSIFQRRIAEETLLDIGAEYQRALLSYANATTNGQRSTPQNLNDLIKDPRYPKVIRHLRRIYNDPLTGKNNWGVIRAKDQNGFNGIIGIYSLSDQTPIKIGNFPQTFTHFTNKSSYQEWIFYHPALQPHARQNRSEFLPNQSSK
nr:type II secretion system protein [uncultured Undibacterium sp.]